MKELALVLAHHRYTQELVTSTLIALGVYLVCAAIIVVAERAGGRGLNVYKSSNALSDLAYTVFYKCSIYNVIAFPLFAWVGPWFRAAPANPLRGLPEPLALILCWIIFDFLNYWVHRMQHSVRFLWSLHSIHHSQRELTFLTANRIHAVEQLYTGFLLLVPALLLGIGLPRWLPLLMLQVFSETMQHARLDWSFGRIGRLVVSPAFHAVHHSIDERDHDANFGRLFSLWDRIFGTFIENDGSPKTYGVSGVEVPDSLIGQFVHPFRRVSTSA